MNLQIQTIQIQTKYPGLSIPTLIIHYYTVLIHQEFYSPNEFNPVSILAL